MAKIVTQAALVYKLTRCRVTMSLDPVLANLATTDQVVKTNATTGNTDRTANLTVCVTKQIYFHAITKTGIVFANPDILEQDASALALNGFMAITVA